MNASTILPLLAQWDIRLRSTADTRSFLVLLIVAASAAIVASVVRWYWQWHERHKHRSPAALFRELCRVHQLGWSDRRLIAQFAMIAGAKPAATLFVNPDLWTATLAKVPDADFRRRLEQLHERLFGDSAHNSQGNA